MLPPFVADALAMPNSPLPALDLCLKEALDQCRQWIPVWIDRVHALLRERELIQTQPHERLALLEAHQSVHRQRDVVARHWLSALADRIEQAPAAPGQARKPALSLDELELMGDDQVHERVETARVQQTAMLSADDAFNEFTSRLSTAQGFKVVNADLNPLRVQVFVETLLSALKSLDVTPAARARWLQVGAKPLGESLDVFYRHLAAWLGAQGVQPAGYAVVMAPESRVLPDEALAGQDLLEGPMSDQEALLTLDHLHQLLVGDLDGGDATRRTNDSMTRALAGEVVTLMMQRIAADKRLLKPVRNHLQEMKPALLELATSNPRFFADRNNPARRLLDAVTARSLAFTSEQDEGYSGFLQELRHVVYELRRPSKTDLSERFPTLLDQLRQSEDRAVPRGEREARGRAVQTLVKVEQRKLLAEKIANEFRARPDYAKAPGPVRRFLTGVWAQVVAKARIDEADNPPMTSGDANSKRYVDILADLLWSSQLALASQNRPRLVRIIPPVLRTLREGLDSIDYPRDKVEAFFQTLMGLHEAAYKTQRSSEAAAAAPATAEPEADASVLNPDDAELWMRQHEAKETNFYDESLPETTQPGFQATQPMQRDWVDIKAEMVLRDATSLAVGSWFDLQQEGQALRVQLTWASPHGTLFLFGTASGKSMSMTRRGVDRLIEQDKLRVVADHSVVDEALDAVAQQALKNSGKR